MPNLSSMYPKIARMDRMSEHFSTAVPMEVDTGMLGLSLIDWVDYNIILRFNPVLKSFNKH